MPVFARRQSDGEALRWTAIAVLASVPLVMYLGRPTQTVRTRNGSVRPDPHPGWVRGRLGP
jgi:hypothetical protein